jgi:hypothetical protein
MTLSPVHNGAKDNKAWRPLCAADWASLVQDSSGPGKVPILRGDIGGRRRCLHRIYTPTSITGMGIMTFPWKSEQ